MTAIDTALAAEARHRPTETGALERYLGEIARYPLLSRDDEQRLARAARDGDTTARTRLIEANLRLVVSIARPYARPGVDVLDLIQEGNLGLMTAASRYEPRPDVRFATYAAWWIRSRVVQAVAAATPVRVPGRATDTLARARQAERDLEQRLRRTPTSAEVAAEAEVPAEALAAARRAARPAVSLHAPLGGAEVTLADVIGDRDAPDHDEVLIARETRARLGAALHRLDPRTRQVIALRYGLDGEEPRSLTDVAGRLRISRERVRQMEGRTLRALARDPHLRDGAPRPVAA